MLRHRDAACILIVNVLLWAAGWDVDALTAAGRTARGSSLALGVALINQFSRSIGAAIGVAAMGALRRASSRVSICPAACTAWPPAPCRAGRGARAVCRRPQACLRLGVLVSGTGARPGVLPPAGGSVARRADRRGGSHAGRGDLQLESEGEARGVKGT